jgi:hypothetical protein
MEVIEGKFGQQPKPGGVKPEAAKELRAIADRIERGELESLLVTYCDGSQYRMYSPNSNVDTLTLASLAQSSAVDAFRSGS